MSSWFGFSGDFLFWALLKLSLWGKMFFFLLGFLSNSKSCRDTEVITWSWGDAPRKHLKQASPASSQGGIISTCQGGVIVRYASKGKGKAGCCWPVGMMQSLMKKILGPSLTYIYFRFENAFRIVHSQVLVTYFCLF